MPDPLLPKGTLLDVTDGHRVWWAERGPAAAPPVLIVHGGPGGRTRPASLGWFDGLPARCIVFDQRGCGQSLPSGGLVGNTLDALLDDMERLREHLGLVRWAVAGGSWGALVAIAYAAAHPDRIDGLFLRSPFFATTAELERFFAPFPAWLGSAGARWIGAPEPLAPLALLTRYGAAEPAVGRTRSSLHRGRLAHAWDLFERLQAAPNGLAAVAGAVFDVPDGGACAATESDVGPPDALPDSLAVHAHYLRHGCFMPEAAMSKALARLDGWLPPRPVALVYGQADAVCDPALAAALARRWAFARNWAVPQAGHDMSHPALRAALVAAARDWVARLSAGASV